VKYFAFSPLDRELSMLALGTVGLGTRPWADCCELLDAWIECGGNVIDCAREYDEGASERLLGRWLDERRAHDRVAVLTKGGHPDAGGERVTPDAIAADLAASLDALRTDAIDLYVLHRDDPRHPVGPIIDALEEHRHAGRIRAFGASNWKTTRLEEAAAYAASRGVGGFSLSSPNLSLARQQESPWAGCVSASDPASRAWYERTQLPLFAWSAQAGGFFTGRFRPERRDDDRMVRVYYCEDNWERLRRADEAARSRGCSANEIALAWVLRQPFPTCAIVGCRTPEELRSSLSALSIELTDAEVQWLDLDAVED
jgi:aryl-alcohol dehydrogenase-like predicted oxidoreductase